MPAEIAPPELALLVDFAERPRARDWSMRAALVRYAQPQPQRVNDLLDVVRRTEWAIGKHTSYIAREGDALWKALSGDDANKVDPQVEGILQIAQTLDRLGDVLATWAASDHAEPRPDAAVDEVTADVARRLDALGIPQQEPPPGPRNRG